MRSAPTNLITTDIRVRFRCHDCDVAWTDIAWTETAQSACWVCGLDGSTQQSEQASLASDQFDLDFC